MADQPGGSEAVAVGGTETDTAAVAAAPDSADGGGSKSGSGSGGNSVFGDFQRMWVQRFPQSSLSDAWELDVRASLQRHRQRIGELRKELEQEQLYVEYLERLLSDVERQRVGEMEAANNARTSTGNLKTSSSASSSASSGGANATSATSDENRSSPVPQQAKSHSQTQIQPNANGSVAADTVADKNPALQQCITELSSNLRSKSELELQQPRGRTTFGTPATTASATIGSHFVTVIEVKEQQQQQPTTPATPQPTATTTADGQLTDRFVSEPLAAVLDAKKKIPPRPPPKFVRRAAPVEPPTVPQSAAANVVDEPTFSSPKSQSSSLDRNLKPSEILRQKSSDSLDVKLSRGGGLAANAGSSSNEQQHRNTNPDAGRQFDGLLADELGRKLVGKAESFERQRRPDAFKRNQSPTEFAGSSGSPTGSLHKHTATTHSPNGSLGKVSGIGRLQPHQHHQQQQAHSTSVSSSSAEPSVGSRESLGGGISERIKSYESISSISSSDRTAAHQQNTALALAAANAAADAEPFYDTVPLDNNGDGEYVYIQAGGTGGSSSGRSNASSRDDISNAGSTLPMSVAAVARSAHRSARPQPHGAAVAGQMSGEPESPGRSSNYVNIDYFLSQPEARSSSMDSDDGGDTDVPPLMRTISRDDAPAGAAGGAMLTPTSARRRKLSDTQSSAAGSGGSAAATAAATAAAAAAASAGLAAQATATSRSTPIRHICASIIGSETLYVDCLNKMMQYMKAIRATLTTSQPVITQDEFATMFFKIDELHELHTTFLRQLRAQVGTGIGDNAAGDVCVGETFRRLAEHISVYGAFLHNYGRAIETVKKCGANNQQFKEIVSRIVVNSSNEQSLSLEDLLHKPVARVQKNALVLQDLLNQTPPAHPDFAPLRTAQKMIRTFLAEFNVVPTKAMLPALADDKALRRLVKNSFIVELADAHRKLRHLFLFNDVIACAKYKASGRDRFEYELKWFIPLRDICVLEESAFDPKEHSPVNILQLKSQACTVRDQLLLEQREAAAASAEKAGGSVAGVAGGGTAGAAGGAGGADETAEPTAAGKKQRTVGEKHRKKLHDLEAQLVLASPNLVLRISNRATNKTAVFFLSSDYERTQWIDCIMQLQQSSILPGAAQPIHIYDLQAWIGACQTLIKTEMGSYLMRSGRDESLLVGDLQMSVLGLQGAEAAADFYVCVEVDSYGHYFRKARTKLVCRSAQPQWNETFVLELEGSQNVRVLLYEDQAPRQVLRAKYVIQLSRQWLTGEQPQVNRVLRMSDALQLQVAMRFVPGEVSLRRVPTSKAGALFGAKMQQVLKREKRPFPFILSACIREVERRGMCEVGIYRVSGSASDLARLKKSFETNNYEAEQLLKEVDIHSVTGILKSYLRELPEALFTDSLYPKLFDVFNSTSQDGERASALAAIFAELPDANRASVDYILAHLIRVHQQEAENKMSLHNLAMVFGPTLLRPGPNVAKHKDLLESSTVDVMAQAGILYCFLQARNHK